MADNMTGHSDIPSAGQARNSEKMKLSLLHPGFRE